MSCSKPLPPFVCDSLYYLNRDQLERFSIVCCPLKNFIERYLHSKPYRIFDRLAIHSGLYALFHNRVQWHPNRDDYSVQQFLAGQGCSIDEVCCKIHSPIPCTYHSFAEMLPYFNPTVRVKVTNIVIAGESIYNPDHIAEMESIAYLWRNGDIIIRNAVKYGGRIIAEDFQPILNSPTILQCQTLSMINAHFSFKDYKVLYTMKVILLDYDGDDDTDYNSWREFLEQPELKPIVALHYLRWKNIDKALDRVKEAFSSTVLSNTFKVVFLKNDESLTEFRETNKTSGEKLELKKGFPMEWQEEIFKKYHHFTLERSTI